MCRVHARRIGGRWRWATTVLATLLLLLVAAPLAAATQQPAVEIVFLVDDSASITSANYIIEQQGLASALGNPAIMPQDGTVAVAVLQFSTTVRTVAPLQTITALNAGGISSLVLMALQEGQSTDLTAGLRAAAAALQDGRAGVRKIICVITDGIPDDPVEALSAAAQALSVGVSEIDALGVGRAVDVNFLAALSSPKPPASFAVVGSYEELAQAIAAKTKQLVTPPARRGEQPSENTLSSLEALLHDQAGLITSFADLLQSQWGSLSAPQRQDRSESLERLLRSQQDLLERFAGLINTSVCPEQGAKPQLAFVNSFEALLHGQAELLLRFEQIIKNFEQPPAALLESLEGLIHGQGGLVNRFEDILHCLSALPQGVPAESWNELLSSFEGLIHSQEALIRGFSGLLGG